MNEARIAAQDSVGEVLCLRRFRVEYDADGAPFVWEGEAVGEQAAIRCAAHDLVLGCPTFAGEIRATSVIEVAP
jgi:hypothetical protein